MGIRGNGSRRERVGWGRESVIHQQLDQQLEREASMCCASTMVLYQTRLYYCMIYQSILHYALYNPVRYTWTPSKRRRGMVSKVIKQNQTHESVRSKNVAITPRAILSLLVTQQ